MKKKTYLFLFLQRDVFPVTMNRSRSTTANILHLDLEFENTEVNEFSHCNSLIVILVAKLLMTPCFCLLLLFLLFFRLAQRNLFYFNVVAMEVQIHKEH